MLLTPHTLVGIAIGATVQNPLIAVPLAFTSHFLGDIVPHWDFYEKLPTFEEMRGDWRPAAIIADILIGMTTGIFFTLHALWVNHNPALAVNIFLCGLAAVAPDGMYAPIIFLNSKNIIFNTVYNWQKVFHSKVGPILGNISQLVVMTACLWLILNSLAR